MFLHFHWGSIIVVVLFVSLSITGTLGTILRNKALLVTYGVLSIAGLLLFTSSLLIAPFTVISAGLAATLLFIFSAIFALALFGLAAVAAWYLYVDTRSTWQFTTATATSTMPAEMYNPSDFYAANTGV
jgi:hypothetical protein